MTCLLVSEPSLSRKRGYSDLKVQARVSEYLITVYTATALSICFLYNHVIDPVAQSSQSKTNLNLLS